MLCLNSMALWEVKAISLSSVLMSEEWFMFRIWKKKLEFTFLSIYELRIH
jgi:hypothetical protein